MQTVSPTPAPQQGLEPLSMFLSAEVWTLKLPLQGANSASWSPPRTGPGTGTQPSEALAALFTSTYSQLPKFQSPNNAVSSTLQLRHQQALKTASPAHLRTHTPAIPAPTCSTCMPTTPLSFSPNRAEVKPQPQVWRQEKGLEVA